MIGMGKGLVAGWAVIVLAMVTPVAGTGQTSLTVSGGPGEYDLSGTGWSGTVAAHVERSALPWLRVELGSGLFWYRTQGSSRVMMLLPEAGVAAQASGPVPVYLGVGVGHSVKLRGNETSDPTLYGAVGLSLPVGDAWHVRPEMRVRSIDPWTGVIAGFTVGVTRRLGS